MSQVILSMPSESRVQMTVKIPVELHSKMTKVVSEEKYTSMSAVILKALEKELQDPMGTTENHVSNTVGNTAVILDDQNELLKLEQDLLKKDGENAVLLANYQGAQVLIANKDERTAELKEQLAVKDAQIAKLTETMNAQSVHIQSLINQKQIEAPGSKRAWWKFW